MIAATIKNNIPKGVGVVAGSVVPTNSINLWAASEISIPCDFISLKAEAVLVQ